MCHRRRPAQPHNRLQPLATDPFQKTGTRALQSCRFQDPPRPVFHVARAPVDTFRLPGTATLFLSRSPVLNNRSLRVDRVTDQLLRIDENVRRVGHGDRARFQYRMMMQQLRWRLTHRDRGLRCDQVSHHEERVTSIMQVIEAVSSGAGNLQGCDRCRKIRDRDPSARITSDLDHHYAFFKPVSSLG